MDDVDTVGRASGAPAADVSQASVHLRLIGRLGDEDLTALRQQLAACLCSGVTDIRVHVEEQDELDLPVLLALHGVAGYLQRRGGALTVVGARPRVVAAMTINDLVHLLPSEGRPAAVKGAGARTARARRGVASR